MKIQTLAAIAHPRKQMIQWLMMILGGAIVAAPFLLDFLRGNDLFEVGPVQWVVVGIGTSLMLLGSFIVGRQWVAFFIRYFVYYPSLLLFIVGTFLLAVNTYGLFTSIRSQLVYDERYFDGVYRRVKYTPGEIYGQMNQREGESNQDYVHRLTELIFDGMSHYWDKELTDELNLQVPIHENYIIYFRHQLGLSHFATYEFYSAERAIERGVGLCSQMSKVLVDALTQNGIEAYGYGLEGHVVTIAKVDPNTNIWWLLDADYGVVIAENIKEIEKQPDLVMEAYRRAGYSEGIVQMIAKYYSSTENNLRITNNAPYEREVLDYYWKWRMPVLGMFPFLLILGAKKLYVSAWVAKRD